MYSMQISLYGEIPQICKRQCMTIIPVTICNTVISVLMNIFDFHLSMYTKLHPKQVC